MVRASAVTEAGRDVGGPGMRAKGEGKVGEVWVCVNGIIVVGCCYYCH